MSRRPATFTQADVARAIRAAKQAGASEVEVKSGDAVITIKLAPSTVLQEGQTEGSEIVL